jgi:hypothetical protein
MILRLREELPFEWLLVQIQGVALENVLLLDLSKAVCFDAILISENWGEENVTLSTTDLAVAGR